MSKKILIIGPSWVGDMVMAQTLFKLLKEQDPTVIIDVLAPTWTFSLLNRMPEVTLSIEMPLAHGELRLKKRYQIAKKLRAHQYTQAIVLPNSFKSAFIPWAAKIPQRTGWRGEWRYFFLNDVRHLDKQQYPLMIEQFMALGREPNKPLPSPIYPFYPSFKLTQVSQEAALAKHRPIWRGRPVLALAVGAEFGPAKRWPEEHYAKVANHQLAAGRDVWLFGSQNDRPIADKIMALTHHRCDNLAGRLQLDETMDLLALTRGLVSNDSGLMHVAAALDLPVIGIYGSTSPAFTPPLSKKASILQLELDCQPCFKRTCPFGHYRCLREITPEHVLAIIAGWDM